MKIFEVTTKMSPDTIAEKLLRDCKPWLESIGNNMAFRGIKSHKPTLKVKQPINRMPTSTDLSDHYSWVEAFNSMGFKANRDNSFFVFGNRYGNYGESIYGFFPIGKYDFTWSPEIRDLFVNGNTPYTKTTDASIQVSVINENSSLHISDIAKKISELISPYKITDQKNGYETIFYLNAPVTIFGKIRDTIRNSEYFKEIGIYVSTHSLKYKEKEYIDKTVEQIKSYNYRQNDNIQEALLSNNEIMIACKAAWMIQVDIIPWKQINIKPTTDWIRT